VAALDAPSLGARWEHSELASFSGAAACTLAIVMICLFRSACCVEEMAVTVGVAKRGGQTMVVVTSLSSFSRSAITNGFAKTGA
jgi:hypothetical protein